MKTNCKEIERTCKHMKRKRKKNERKWGNQANWGFNTFLREKTNTGNHGKKYESNKWFLTRPSPALLNWNQGIFGNSTHNRFLHGFYWPLDPTKFVHFLDGLGILEYANLEKHHIFAAQIVSSHMRMPKNSTYKNQAPYFSTDGGHFCITAPSAIRQRCTISP